MKVNSNDTNLASQFISNGSEVKVNKPVNGKEQINSEMERLAKDIYHKDQPKEPEATYDKPMNISTNNVVSRSKPCLACNLCQSSCDSFTSPNSCVE